MPIYFFCHSFLPLFWREKHTRITNMFIQKDLKRMQIIRKHCLVIQYIIMMLSYRNGWWWKWKRNFPVAVGQSNHVLKWRFLASNHLHLLSGRTGLAAAPICLGWVPSQVEAPAVLSNSSLYTTFLPLKFVSAVTGKKKNLFAQGSFLLATSGY